jgi:DNA circularisation protein N-terminus
MRPMIDDLELPQVQELRTDDRRRLAEHRAPGRDGSVLQNLGRGSTRIQIYGVASGPDSLELVAQLDGLLRDQTPVPFAADIVADAAIETVVIDDLRVEELAGKPDRHAYLVTLREHLEPVEPAAAPGIDADILAEAGALIDEIAAGLAALPGLLTGLESLPETLGGFLARLREAAT